jgi:hypothetical protein
MSTASLPFAGARPTLSIVDRLLRSPMSTIPLRSALVLLLAAGCASTPGAHPHDMSVAHHEAEASEHTAEANRHAAMSDAPLRAGPDRCLPAGPSGSSNACWTSIANPTEEHRREAERHRQMAADHRAASQTLRDAEARACSGLRDSDRDMSPFAHREDIANVAPLTMPADGDLWTSPRTVGSVVTFRAVPGMTAGWLQRVVDCHLARNAALGHVSPEMPSCPLVPHGVAASVSSTGSGFAVAIRADDPGTIAEIQRRARTLAPAAP